MCLRLVVAVSTLQLAAGYSAAGIGPADNVLAATADAAASDAELVHSLEHPEVGLSSSQQLPAVVSLAAESHPVSLNSGKLARSRLRSWSIVLIDQVVDTSATVRTPRPRVRRGACHLRKAWRRSRASRNSHHDADPSRPSRLAQVQASSWWIGWPSYWIALLMVLSVVVLFCCCWSCAYCLCLANSERRMKRSAVRKAKMGQ